LERWRTVIVRIIEDQVALDLRTVTPDDEKDLIEALRDVANE